MEPRRKIVKSISSYFPKITRQQAVVQTKQAFLDLEVKEVAKVINSNEEEAKAEPKVMY